MADPTEDPNTGARPSLWQDAVRLMFRAPQLMADPTEDEIRTRAFQLWKDAAEPDGMADAFWYQAEKELLRRLSDKPAEDQDSR
jgi:hypothetical protein